MYGVLFVKEILTGSLASDEGSLRPLDLIHYINGAPTQDLTLSESTRLLELSLNNVTLKATRLGHTPRTWDVSFVAYFCVCGTISTLWGFFCVRLKGTGSRSVLGRRVSLF